VVTDRILAFLFCQFEETKTDSLYISQQLQRHFNINLTPFPAVHSFLLLMAYCEHDKQIVW